jgi:D-3-phosphoglycerate dehydrogenase
MKILISDKLSDAGLDIFKSAQGIEILNMPGLGKDVAKLKQLIADVDAIAIRSETKLTAEILDCAKKLKVIGRAGIGVDNVDIPAASKRGIIVMNTPGGNVITTAEHAIAMMCALTRKIPQATASLKSGKWEKSKFTGSELFNKTLGVVGCGNIGKIVASRALGLRMKVISFDPFLADDVAKELDIEKVTLGEIFKRADYITVHTPLNDKTRNLINKAAFEQMKKGVYLVNCARGGIVNEADLESAIQSGIVAGAALDVFEEEPVKPNHPLLKLDQVIATPHLGAATEEAQENVSLEVAQEIVDFLVNGNIVNALNAASASGETIRKLGPVINLGQKLGWLHGQLCTESPTEITIGYFGDITAHPVAPVTTAILQGILTHMLSDVAVNSVNAPYLAKERGIRVQETITNGHSDYTTLIEVVLKFKNHQHVISGSIFGKNNPRVVRFNTIETEFVPEGTILIIQNHDKPGVVGRIGTFLGNSHVNIVNIQLGLDEKSKMATAFYSIQGACTEDVLAGLKQLEGIHSVVKVEL